MHSTHQFAWLVAGGAECAICGSYWLDRAAFEACVPVYRIVMQISMQQEILPAAVSAEAFLRLSRLSAWS